eukprot:m.30892 g.30892  ORF g.30892 m.30892 type:complete len:160 (-) comp8254_c0_seq3:411-890(-)
MVSINMYSLIEQSLFITDGKSAAKYVKKVKEDGGQTNPEKAGFSLVVNVSDKVFYFPSAPGMQFTHLPLDDFGKTRLDKEKLIEIFQQIDTTREANHSVLIHCTHGVNRAVIVTTAYLMYKKGISFDQAFEIVKRGRPQATPNDLYCGQLKDLKFEASS